MKIDVVIVNWNGVGFLKNVIPDLLRVSSKKIEKIIVVDNGSTDDSFNFLSSLKGVEVVFLKENKGYAAGNNAAIPFVVSEIVWLLNNDTRVDRDINLEVVVDKFMEDDGLAIIGPQLVLPDGVLQPGAAGFDRGIMSQLAWAFCFSGKMARIFKPYYINQKDFRREIFLDWVSGAAMFVRRDVFLKVGGVPEDFFMYAEDIKLCRNVKKIGGGVMYVPEVSVTHIHGGTEKKLTRNTRWIKSTVDEYEKSHGRVSSFLIKYIMAIGFLNRAIVNGLLFLIKNKKINKEKFFQMLEFAIFTLKKC